MTDEVESFVLHVPARNIPSPAHLTPAARSCLQRVLPAVRSMPALDDKAAWQDFITTFDASMLEVMGSTIAGDAVTAKEHQVDGIRIWDILPAPVDPEKHGIVLELHGGGLILGGGEVCKLMGIGAALRYQSRTWAVDYRMAPDDPYPASLDDCLTAYRELLRQHAPTEIVVAGVSAGGNLAAALLLRARAEGLPMPAGLILGTPEADLTETGDTFHTNDGVDTSLGSLKQVNLLYANGHDLTDPYLSPLFGDVSGFPPTLLASGTRDLYLSNTVRMHRKLRAAGVEAELHVLEAAVHAGFYGTPEGEELDQEIRLFIAKVLGRVDKAG